MAKVVGIGLGSVQAIWKAHGLVPHRDEDLQAFQGPQFIKKLRDIVGLCMNPPAHSLVLSVTRRARSSPSTALSPACR